MADHQGRAGPGDRHQSHRPVLLGECGNRGQPRLLVAVPWGHGKKSRARQAELEAEWIDYELRRIAQGQQGSQNAQGWQAAPRPALVDPANLYLFCLWVQMGGLTSPPGEILTAPENIPAARIKDFLTLLAHYGRIASEDASNGKLQPD